MADYFEQVRAAALARVPAILQEWLPGGRVEGHTYYAATLSGGEGRSFKVNLLNGKWGEWGAGITGSDPISLYAAIHGWEGKEGYVRALHELGEQFSIPRPKVKRSWALHWQIVAPIPADAYSCSDEGMPLIPDGIFDRPPDSYWPYFDQNGELLCFHLRFNGPRGRKEMPWLSYARNKESGECQWQKRGLPDPKPLYGLIELGGRPDNVIIVEGEKNAEAARRLLPDWCAVTWGGPNGAKFSDWTPLLALPESIRILLWPDNDDPGKMAMKVVAETLGRDVETVTMDPLATEV